MIFTKAARFSFIMAISSSMLIPLVSVDAYPAMAASPIFDNSSHNFLKQKDIAAQQHNRFDTNYQKQRRSFFISSQENASNSSNTPQTGRDRVNFQKNEVPSVVDKYQAPQSVADLASVLLGAVVNISTTQTVEGIEDTENLSLPPSSSDDAPFDKYFKDFFSNKDGKGSGRKAQSLGSGFIVDADKGLVVTNNHVISDADDIEVNFSDGSKLKAKLLGKDGKTDIALLQIDPKEKKLQAVSFGDSNNGRIGDWVMAIGNPFGFGGSVSLGIISARNRNINSGPYDDFIQTDAAINRGNSGGPLFDMHGRVIGINTAIVSPSGGSIGIGFAIPSEIAAGVVDQLRKYGETRRGWLAVRIQPVTKEIAQAYNLDKAEGAVVSGHIAGAKDVDNKQLHDGDIILRFGSEQVKDARLLPRMAAERSVGVPVPVEVWRNGKKQIVHVKPGLLDENSDEENNESDEPSLDESHSNKKQDKEVGKNATDTDPILGMELSNLNADIRNDYNIVKDLKGVAVLDVDIGSNAQEKHIVAGDVIVAVNQENVKNKHDIEKRLEILKDSGRKNALLMIASPEGNLRFVTVLLD